MSVGCRRTVGNFGALVGVLWLLAAVAASPALAQVGLPPSYDVQRIDSPNVELGGGFGDAATSAGDLNGDGEDDIIAYQLAGSPGEDGEVYVISGETGGLIDTIVAPEQDTDAVGVEAGTPPPGDNESNFAFPWISKLGTNQGTSPADFTDLASCPGATAATETCPVAVGPPDGIPEILVGARGVDAKGQTDAGRAYVFDGRTRALLKKIDMPAAEAAPAVARGTAAGRLGGPWFGRAVLNPAGQPGCTGNSSVGACQAVSRAVQIGDMDGSGRPDIVISASATTESTGAAADGGSADPSSQCAATAAGSYCQAAGRTYVYRGEEIVGSNPQEILDGATNGDTPAGSNGAESVKQLRALNAQSNPGGTELFGNALTAIGDVGACTAMGIQPGARCPDAASTATPDGKPDVVVGALRVDLPVDSPGGDSTDEGVSYLVDGASGAVLRTYAHPDPQNVAIFGSQVQQPAPGDLGGSALPDAYIPATSQDTEMANGGRGYVLSGDFKLGDLLVSEIKDPTPNENEGFGNGSVGVGDLVGGAANPANELLVGSGGTTVNPAPPPPNDMHFFNAATGRVLQTVSDPDNQPGSSFGEAPVGLGDLNEDGFLDFGVGASQFTQPGGSSEGRLYIFRSRKPPTPTPPGTPAPGTTPTPTPARILPNMVRPAGAAKQFGRNVLVTVRGRMIGTRGRLCGGRVKIGVRFARNRRVTRAVRMRSNCRYSARVSFPLRRLPRSLRPRRRALLVRVSARFQGNAGLRTDLSPTKRIKARR